MANADYDSDQIALKGKLGRTFNYNPRVFLTPYAELHYINLDMDGYTESGAGTANLRVGSERVEALESSLGLSVHMQLETARGTKVIPEGHIAWRHEFLNDEHSATSTFTGGGAAFSTSGLDPSDDSLNIGASLAIYGDNNVDIKVAYDYETKSEYDGHSGMVIARYSF